MLLKSFMPKPYLAFAEEEEANISASEDLDKKMDDVLDKAEKGELSDSSSEKEAEGKENQDTETPGSDQTKTDKVKEVEDDSTLSVEQKIEKVKEILGDDQKAIDAYVKEKGFHKDPAWQKQRELIDGLRKQLEAGTISDEDKKKLEEFDTVTSSREYIEASMKSQGFTKEAINAKLKEKGFDVAEGKTKDDFELVTRTLNIDPKTVNKAARDDIEDIAKISRIIAEDIINSRIPEQLKPIQQFLGDVSQKESADKLSDVMEKTVKDEGVLDWDKDVEPELQRYMDAHPNATQNEVFTHFKEFTRKANLERLKGGKRAEERDGKKKDLRQIKKGGGADTNFPQKTGDFDKDADALFDHLGVT